MLDVQDALLRCVDASCLEDNLDDRINAAFRAIINYDTDPETIVATRIIIALTAVSRCVSEQYARLFVEVCDQIPQYMRAGIADDMSMLPPRHEVITDMQGRYNGVVTAERRFLFALGLSCD